MSLNMFWLAEELLSSNVGTFSRSKYLTLLPEGCSARNLRSKANVTPVLPMVSVIQDIWRFLLALNKLTVPHSMPTITMSTSGTFYEAELF